MRIRKQALGDRNIVGAKIEQKRKSMGMKQKDLLTRAPDQGASTSTHRVFPSFRRSATLCYPIFELKAISEVLGMSYEELLG